MIKGLKAATDIIIMKTRTYGIFYAPKRFLSFCVVSLFFLSSCGVVVRSGDPTGEPSGKPASPRELKRLGIPPGHLPPPGSCRIWIPGAPPGHQSPAGDCAELKGRVPTGAWLLHRDGDNPDEIQVFEYDERQPSVVAVIRYFEASTGRYLRDGTD